MTDAPFFTVSKGGPPPEQDIPDGVYVVQLRDIKDPRTVSITRGPKAGQEMDLIDWIFVVADPTNPNDGRQLDESTSTATGPRSKAFAWITALLGGRPPAVGQQFSKADLIGRLALATVNHGDDGMGWPSIANLGAVPASMLAQSVAQATGAPLAAVPAAGVGPGATTLRDQVAASAPPAGQVGDLPF